MGVLRDKMIRELQLRRYAAATQKAYLEAVVGLTKHFWIAPDQLSATQVQDYLLYLMTERKLHWNSVNTICSGLTFFYTQTLKRPDVGASMPQRRNPRQLPEILSAEELEALFAAVAHPLYRALLMTTYAGGLRVSEVCKLRPTDIDSQRMMIRVEAGKRGHSSIDTTALYLHVTRKKIEATQSPLDLLDLSGLTNFQEVPPCQPS